MNAVCHQKEQERPGIGPLFMLLVSAAFIMTSYLPKAFFTSWRDIVMWLSTVVGTVCGFTMTNSADILTVNGFAMRIANECTALNYVIILSTAILLYTYHTISYRLTGVAIAVPLIAIANAFRLVITGYTGTISWNLFNITHEYIWVILFALLIFAIWKLWVDGRLLVSKTSAQRAAVMVVSCSIVYGLLLAMADIYGQFLAYFSSLFFKAILNDAQAAIVWTGQVMQGSHAGQSSQLRLIVEYFNIAVYIGLILPQQKWRDRETLFLSFFCLVASLLMNALLIAYTSYYSMTHGQDAVLPLLSMEKGLLLALPFVLWWIVTGYTPSASKQSV